MEHAKQVPIVNGIIHLINWLKGKWVRIPRGPAAV